MGVCVCVCVCVCVNVCKRVRECERVCVCVRTCLTTANHQRSRRHDLGSAEVAALLTYFNADLAPADLFKGLATYASRLDPFRLDPLWAETTPASPGASLRQVRAVAEGLKRARVPSVL